MQDQKIEAGAVCTVKLADSFVNRSTGVVRHTISNVKVHVFRINHNGTCMVETLSGAWEACVPLTSLDPLSPLEQLAFHAE